MYWLVTMAYRKRGPIIRKNMFVATLPDPDDEFMGDHPFWIQTVDIIIFFQYSTYHIKHINYIFLLFRGVFLLPELLELDNTLRFFFCCHGTQVSGKRYALSVAASLPPSCVLYFPTSLHYWKCT